MKITEVKVWLVEGVKYNWTLMKVYTDTGHTGVGEAHELARQPDHRGGGETPSA